MNRKIKRFCFVAHSALLNLLLLAALFYNYSGPMNSLTVAAVCLICLWAGYRWYGRFMEGLWQTDPLRKTPALEFQDGVDFVPARHWTVLFGHHFASIAGAAPIVGPVMVCAVWGWFPAVVWIVLGSIFLGAVHDFSALMTSLRERGRSISDVAESVMGYRTKVIFASFLWLSLVLIIAIFAALGAATLAEKPEVVVPTFGLVLVAVLVGLMMYRWKINQMVSTVVGVGLLSGLILLGYHFPINIGGNAVAIWIMVLLIYAYIASVLPVNILLQPRDYLATFVLFFGLFFGYLGILISHPPMHTPAFLGFKGTLGHLWPMLCIFVPCGAVSGFHSLISSGTTSKQMASERHARRIGYGAMIIEGVLALLAVLCVSAGLYWIGAGGISSGFVYPELVKEKGYIVAFAVGFSRITAPIFGKFGILIAIIILNTFIITTLDTATRIGRYLSEELFGTGMKLDWMKNRYISTAVMMVPITYLALGPGKNIWPIFGASNQLVAALVLIVATVYLMGRGRPTKYTLYPALFMLVTILTALIYRISRFFPEGNYLLGGIGIVLVLLALFMVREAVVAVRGGVRS